jgi:lipopolysaccharide transport system ATP-binding protein
MDVKIKNKVTPYISTDIVSKNTEPYIDDDVVLKVENLSKKFCRNLKRSMYYGIIDIMRSMFSIRYKSDKLRKDEFWALDDVSFELKKGEVLGIIGENGSGKSTLLRLITGIFPPDKGRIICKGRVGSLIAVGAGFHPHMTGRENIYLNGTILGMTKKEIDEKFDEIVEFADIGEFIDAPVSTYSSGMYVRLAFAIAIFSKCDILLIDEVISVGDISFRNKSMRKLAELRQNAKGTIFISHNLDQIRVLCDRVIILDKGRIIFQGSTNEGVIQYENLSKQKRIENVSRDNKIEYRKRLKDGDRVFVEKVGLIKQNGPIDQLEAHDPLNVFMDFKVNENNCELYFVLSILNESKNVDCIFIKTNDYKPKEKIKFVPGSYRVVFKINNHHLGPGVYFLNYAIADSSTYEIYDHGLTDICFSVISNNKFERGIINVDYEYDINKKDEV